MEKQQRFNWIQRKVLEIFGISAEITSLNNSFEKKEKETQELQKRVNTLIKEKNAVNLDLIRAAAILLDERDQSKKRETSLKKKIERRNVLIEILRSRIK